VRQVLEAGGGVVALTSDHTTGNRPYGVSKGALDHNVISAARELGLKRISANVVNTGYDAIGQATNVTLPAMGGLSAETVTTGYRKSGSAETLTLTSGTLSTPLVTGMSYSGTGQMLSRTYGNGLTRNYGWHPDTRALTDLSASFVTSESGSAQTVFVQKDSFTRDVMGRIVQSTDEVPVSDGTAADGQVTSECFAYDGFNRLSGAWTVADPGSATCGNDAPADAAATGWDASSTAYAAEWSELAWV